MSGAMDMYFMDVGQGDCTYIEAGAADTPDFANFLIDFGFKERQFNGDHPPYQTLQILVDLISKASKAQKLDGPYLSRMFITHPDGDHWNMIGNLIKGTYEDDDDNLWVSLGGWPRGSKLKLGALVFGGAENDYKSRRADDWAEINAAVKDGEITVLGDQDYDPQDKGSGVVVPRWPYLAGGALEIFLISSNFPQRGGGKIPNPKSLCLIFKYDDFKLMLLGDAEPPTIGAKLLKNYKYNDYEFLNCNVLKLAHHGSRKGTPEWWAKIVKPNYAFVSGDYFWSHPYHEAILNIYRAKSLKLDAGKHWISSSKDDFKDYVSDSITEAMFANLWYVVTAENGSRAEDQKGIEKSYSRGMYIGVAWLLSKIEGEDPTIHYSPRNVWPGINAVVTDLKKRKRPG